jgi:uncharacterized protein (TIGR03435 family)
MRLFLLAGFVSLKIWAQPAAKFEVAPKFEVAAINRCESAVGGGAGGRADLGTGGVAPTPGRLRTNCQTVAALIRSAYVRYAEGRNNGPLAVPLSGGPTWINSERYDINAKADGNPSKEVMNGPMLQALLEDRFKLRIHRETKEVPVYVLIAAKNGSKLHPFVEGSCSDGQDGKPRCGLGGIRVQGPILTLEARKIGLAEFSQNILSVLDRPVIDKTGIAGLFDFRLEFVPDETTPALPRLRLSDDSPAGPSIFTAMQEELGLKLEPAKGPGEFLVIDSVERPSEN